MNKFLSFLALGLMAPLFLFTACSDDKETEKTHAELCADGVSEECLIGTWNLNAVVDFNESCNGTLKFYKEGTTNYYSYDGTCGYSYDIGGSWTFDQNSKEIATTCSRDCDFATRRGTVTVSSDGSELSITSKGEDGVITLLKSGSIPNPTEKFTYRN